MVPFENIPDEYRKVGEKWAEAKAQYEFLDSETKTILARLASETEGSEATRDRVAKQDTSYLTHLTAVKQARQEYLGYETYMHALDMRFEWYRSQNANRRAETKLL